VVVPGTCPAPTGDEPALAKVPHPLGGAVCIEPTEVTRGDYEAWLLSGTPPTGMPASCDFDTDHTPTADWPPGGVGLTLPVAYVSWCDALAYCLAIGRRLCGDLEGNPVATSEWSSPTGSEWFTVCTAQGTRPYPYGATYQASTCNGGDVALGQTATVTSMTGCVDATGQVHDLSGNIWEWENACSADTGQNDSCRLRGGGYTNSQNDLMCAADSTDLRGQPRVTVGFRCCADILPE
jgi:formylglycine-generating enzyme required for sulfatase activity